MVHGAGFGDHQPYAAFHPAAIVLRQARQWTPVLAPHALHAGHHKAIRQREAVHCERLEQRGEIQLALHASGYTV